MASSLSRRICHTLLSAKASNFSSSFCTKTTLLSSSSESDSVDPALSDLDSDPFSPSTPLQKSNDRGKAIGARPLENGLDSGIYKAILVGQVGQAPIQKKFKSGRGVTLLCLGTGGIRNNRRPLDNEEPRDYANRCAVQWHRVSVYPDMLAELAFKNVVPGSILYVEGNLETKIFNDPITGLVRRIREVAVRHNGRLVFLGQGSDAQKTSQGVLRAIGYY